LAAGLAATGPAKGVYNISSIIIVGFEEPLHGGEGEKKTDVKELGRESKERGRKSMGRHGTQGWF